MASVSVLYIQDGIVGPHLELLRSVCLPSSGSPPHVTVRYFARIERVRRQHLSTKVSRIDLVGPGAFGLEDLAPEASCVVYIACESDELEALEHKPDYPTSEFHVTLYEGKSAVFARALLRLLQRFRWGYSIPLPENTTLTEVPLTTRKARRTQSVREFSGAAKALFHQATGQELSGALLADLADEGRLKLIDAICKHLARCAAHLPRITRVRHEDAGSAATPHTETHDDAPVHVTPPELAHEIAEYAVGLLDPDVPVEFGDPAVGVGAFYQALRHILPQKRIASAIGVDINFRMVAAARRRWADRGLDVRRGDYLHMEQLPPRTLILANPPYLRHQDIPTDYKEELRQRASVSMGRRVSGLSGEYVYFLLLSHAWMARGAVAAWLIPSEFMQTGYGGAVRHYLTHTVELIRVHRFGHDDPQFEKADVLPAVVVFRNRPPTAGQTAILSAGGTLRECETEDKTSVDELRHQSKWVIPRCPSRTYASPALRIGDLFTVRRGIATGANDFFIMERGVAVQLGLPEGALRPMLPKVRALGADIVERDADGYPRVCPQLCLLDCDLGEDEIARRYPRLMEYLATAQELGLRDRTLVRQRRPWYMQERRTPSPFLCTYMGRGRPGTPALRFIWNKSDAIATNTYLMLYPRDALASLLADRPEVAAGVFALLQETARETIGDNARLYSGGLRKIEPRELLDVRLPSAPPWLQPALDGQLHLAQVPQPAV